MSNSEVEGGGGGVGAITFDKNGKVIGYRRLLTGTERNCNGGKTDWGAWISCEEDEGQNGKVWQVDPFGERDPVQIALGSNGGRWEAFAHDTRDPDKLYAFLTEDIDDGALVRMTIENPDYSNPWDILLESGKVEYLILNPVVVECDGFESGTFRWTENEADARTNAANNYPFAEGMKMDGDQLKFVSKESYGIITINLDIGTYTFEETGFDGQPDQFIIVEQEDGSNMMYLTEEADVVRGTLGTQVGIHTRNDLGGYTNIILGDDYSAGKWSYDSPLS